MLFSCNVYIIVDPVQEMTYKPVSICYIASAYCNPQRSISVYTEMKIKICLYRRTLSDFCLLLLNFMLYISIFYKNDYVYLGR